MQLLGYTVSTVLVLDETAKLYSRVAAPFYIPTGDELMISFLTSLPHSMLSLLKQFVSAIQKGM